MVPGPAEETFVQFAARSADWLTHFAYLLCGDRDQATRLARAGLASAEETWPRHDVVFDLVQTWLDSPSSANPGADLVAGSEHGPVWSSLAALPPRQRAAVVLRYWADLPVAAVAAALHRSEPTVVTETTEGIDDLRGVAEPLAGSVEAALRLLAATGPAAPLDAVVEQARARRQRRRRSVLGAAGVLVLAGVLASVLGGPVPEEEVAVPPDQIVVTDEPRWTRVVPELGEVVVDDEARRLTRQFVAARDQALGELAELPTYPLPRAGGQARPPLEFYTHSRAQPPGTYYAGGAVGDLMLLMEVRKREAPKAKPAGYEPCQQADPDCLFRLYPDGTRADVVVYTDPASRHVTYSLSSLRPDGTLFHVTMVDISGDPGPPPISVADLFRFAQVFTY